MAKLVSSPLPTHQGTLHMQFRDFIDDRGRYLQMDSNYAQGQTVAKMTMVSCRVCRGK